MPKVSVIITTHHRPQLLPRAVESARLAGTDIEVVVVDDCSADETAEVCRRMTGIRYVRIERNQRVAGARNLGIMASSGEYLSFLDDDDVRLARSFDRQVVVLESQPDVGLVYGQVLVGDQNCVPAGDAYPASPCPQGDVFWQLLERNFIPCISAVFRRSCLDRVGLLDEAVPGVDDWDLWIRIAELYPVAAVDWPVAVWRKSTATSNQGSSRTVNLISLGSELLRHKWLALPRAAGAAGRRRNAVRQFSNTVSEHLLWEAADSIVTGKFGEAIKALAILLRQHPLSVAGTTWEWFRAATFKLLLAGAFAGDEMSVIKARFKKLRAEENKQ
ncbi:MAG: glycosyltransferase family 2 protein [Pyrinomonadaceae bacterium]